MDSKSFLWLGGGLAVLVLLIVVCMAAFGGVSSSIVKRAEMESATLERKVTTYDSQKSEIGKFISDNKGVLGSLEAQWAAAVADADANISAAKESMKKAKELISKDDGDSEGQIKSELSESNSHLNDATAAMAHLSQEVANTKTFMTQKDEIIKQKQRVADAAQGAAGRVRSLVDQAVTDWPEKKSDLQARLSGLERDERYIKETASKLASAELADAVRLISYVDKLSSSIASQSKTIEGLVGQLYVSWDKILSDMDFQESGWDMNYYHTYKFAKITIVPGGTDKFSEDTKRERVTEQFFDANTDNLGMVLASKPAGKYDHEISNKVQPPLYNRIAPVGQRNHYGHWRDDTWHWNEFMMGAVVGNMLGGSNTVVIRDSDYRNYDRYSRSNRPYYGSTSSGRPQFGSQGVSTQRTLGNAYRRTRSISQAKTAAVRSQQSRKASYNQQRSTSTSTKSSSWGGGWGGSRSGGGK